jgi:hypothetical protein
MLPANTLRGNPQWGREGWYRPEIRFVRLCRDPASDYTLQCGWDVVSSGNGANIMSWWKVLILYFMLLGGLLWFLHRSRRFRDGEEEAHGD